MKNSYFSKLILSTLFLCFLCSLSVPVKATEEIAIDSPVCILMESSTGKIIYEKNSTEKKYPASTTKIMTAILTIENCDLQDQATVSNHAVSSIPPGYSTADLKPGETLSIENLLYALLLPSANDAAVVLAEHIAGSVEEFSTLMNQKAQSLGCMNTHFVNPNGIHDPNHYSTALDLAIIGKYAMQNPTFRQIVQTTKYTLPATSVYPYSDRTFRNTNQLLPSGRYFYSNTTGVKTGFTTAAGECIVASAEQNGVEWIAVILDAMPDTTSQSQRYQDCQTLFHYAFEHYEKREILSQHDPVQELSIPLASIETKNTEAIAEESITALLPKDLPNSSISQNISIDSHLKAPLKKGQTIGKITYSVLDQEYSSSLILKEDVQVSPLYTWFTRASTLFTIYFGIFLRYKLF